MPQQKQQKQQNSMESTQLGAKKTLINGSGDSVREGKSNAEKPMDKLPKESTKKIAVVDNTSHASVSRRAAGSNWNAHCNSREYTEIKSSWNVDQNEENDVPENVRTSPSSLSQPLSKSARLRQKKKAAQRNKYVAMDCEMVGVGLNGQDDMLARVSIVNKFGDVLLDKFVKPREKVVDYRTSISGIRPHNIEHGEEFGSVQDEVIDLLQGKILVGHAIRNDLAVLQIKHPYVNIRDTSRYKPLCRLVSNGRTPSLKRLTQVILGQEIQIGEHNSVEDARAAMNIYNRLSGDWERYIQSRAYKHGK